MRLRWSILAGICIVAAASGIPAVADTSEGSLANIPEGRADFIPESIEDWANPVLTIGRDGISIYRPRLLGVAAQKPMSVVQIRTALIALPAYQWPQGRILAVMQQSIRSGDDNEVIEQYAEDLKEMLDALDVEIFWWPVA